MVDVQAAYDAVARAYDARLFDELDGKPLDRALLDAVVELAGAGTVADVGCGPGHVTRYLAGRHDDVVGVDLSPAMVAIARDRSPELTFEVGSMLELPVGNGAWAAAVSMYSIIHLGPALRATALTEMARCIRSGGRLLVSFHVDSDEFAVGAVNHLTNWFGEEVDIVVYFLAPEVVAADAEGAGFAVSARLERQPVPDIEYPSRRCYLLAQRR